MEVSFSYHAPATKGDIKKRAKNLHLLLEFFVGAFDWFQVPIPIWISVEQLVGTARIRLQMVPQAPFVRNLTFTLMGVPRVEVSAIPMSKALPNVLNLPIISGFVQNGIAAACNEYVAPKSMTLNLAQMLAGDGIKKDTNALGILVVTIHHAEDLSDQDSNGSSDPYIVLAFAKFGKPLYSTRIIIDDLNPVYEETAFLLVTEDDIRADEDLSAQLWDSDKNSADDLIGRVQVPLKEMINHPNQIRKRTDKLKGFEDADSMKGSLTWSIGYFDKCKLKDDLHVEKPDHADGVPDTVKDDGKSKREATIADTTEEAKALTIKPDPLRPSGVLSVIIHQINNLEFQNLTGASGNARENTAGQDTDEPTEQGDRLPSSYCEIIIDDSVEYKTRVKQYTSMPYFEAGKEAFIRDWTRTVVRIVVRAAVVREHDPIMGIVSVNLADIFTSSSQVTRLFSIEDGIGFGRANISFLFKSFNVSLPKSLRGWETGTLELRSDVVFEPNPDHVSEVDDSWTLALDSSNSKAKISSKSTKMEGANVHWSSDIVRLPVYDRYSSSAIFELKSGSLLKRGVQAIAIVALAEIPDDEGIKVRVPVLVAERLDRLRRNAFTDQTTKTHPYQIIVSLYSSCRTVC